MAGGITGSRARGDHHLLGGELVAVVGAQQIATVGLDRPETGMPVIDVNIGARTVGSLHR